MDAGAAVLLALAQKLLRQKKKKSYHGLYDYVQIKWQRKEPTAKVIPFSLPTHRHRISYPCSFKSAISLLSVRRSQGMPIRSIFAQISVVVRGCWSSVCCCNNSNSFRILIFCQFSCAVVSLRPIVPIDLIIHQTL